MNLYQQSGEVDKFDVDATNSVALLRQLVVMLQDSRLPWIQQELLSNTLKPVMLWLGAYYIGVEKANAKGQVLPLGE